MTELADKIEAASRPSRELDAEIEVFLRRYPEGWSRDSFVESVEVVFHHVADGRMGLRTTGGLDHVRWNAPAYTASLDAAMTLVPEGWVSIHGWDYPDRCHRAILMDEDGEVAFRGAARTPALALAAAALRAGDTDAG